MEKYGIVIHGGAGEINESFGIQKYEEALKKIIEHGQKMVIDGDTAINIAVELACQLENCELFNAGKGSVLNNKGVVECDASIMDGRDMNCGAVTGIKNYKNPVKVAKAVMEKSEHVMLMGEGVDEFTNEIDQDFEKEEQDYFITKDRIEQLEKAKKDGVTVLDHSSYSNKYGTIGVVVRDLNGDLAAATSTGGITNKKYGRVGDSPINGAGNFASNISCAVSCTGYGEHFIKTTLAKRVADYVEIGQMSITESVKSSIEYLQSSVDGLGGLIAVDKDGNVASSFNTSGMFHAYCSHNNIPTVSIFEKKLT